MDVNKIYCGNAIEMMKDKIDDESVDLTVTSPPYDSLRSYKGYTFDYQGIIEQLYRVTKKGGVVVWVVGDAVIKKSESGTSFRQALAFMEKGFLLHDTMLYQKNGAAYPAGEKSNRYSQIFEYMFVFSKGVPKTANLIKDRPNRWAGSTVFGRNNTERKKDGDIKIRKARGEMIVQKTGYRDNIWKINNGYGYTTKDKFAYEHPAMFPEQLARDHIITWSDAGGLVLDPMVGSGTTIKQAKMLGRDYIGIDISQDYCNLAEKKDKISMKYIAELWQEGGCDYTIGCGTVVKDMNASNIEEAVNKLATLIQENYTSDETRLSRATLYVVSQKIEVPLEKIYDAIDANIKVKAAEKKVMEELKELERLKEKYDKKTF